MIASANLLQIAASGLLAATEAMQVVSNNTANVNTPGYTAESLQQVDVIGATGSVGMGTEVTSITRAFDQFVSNAVTRASAANQAAQTLQSNAQDISTLFPVASGGAGGLGAAIDNFFSAANQLSTTPASTTQRTAFLSAAQQLTRQVNSIGNQLASARTDINGQLATTVQQINGLTSQIASLNQKIITQNPGSAGPSNALLDQRDQLVQQLSQAVGVSVVREASGALDLYASGGAALVSGTTATTLAARSDAYRDGDAAIVNTGSGQELTADISGGTVGGLLASRQLVENTQGSVGALAASLATAVNTQQALGLDLNGNPGGALFTVGGPTILAAQSNSGTGSLSATISDTNGFTPADFVLTKTVSGFTATNQSTGQTTGVGSGPTLNFDGLAVTVSGTVNDGDSFKLTPTDTAAQTLQLATNDPTAVAAASAYVATAGVNNGSEQATGLGVVAGGDLASGAVIVPATAFGQNLTVKFTSQTGFDVLDSTNAVIASGGLDTNGSGQIAIAYPASAGADQYAAFSLSGGPAALGDSFSLTPGGAGSNGNIAALAGLGSAKLLSGQTLDAAYGALVTGVGSRSQQAQLSAQSAQAVLTQAQNTQQSISGVNLDEQAAELVSFQQAYQASAQVIATAQALFQSLINAVQS